MFTWIKVLLFFSSSSCFAGSQDTLFVLAMLKTSWHALHIRTFTAQYAYPLSYSWLFFFPPLYTALWMVREGSSCGSGGSELSQWAIFFNNTWARLSFRGLSTLYKDGENGIPFPWRNPFGHQCVPIQCVHLYPLFLSERVRPLVSSGHYFHSYLVQIKWRTQRVDFLLIEITVRSHRFFVDSPARARNEENSRFLLCSTSVNIICLFLSLITKLFNLLG